MAGVRPGSYVAPDAADEGLIARVYELCRSDERLDAALVYGSCSDGEADAHSDVEFWLFFEPRQHSEIEPRAWCAQIAPLLHHARNEFRAEVVVFRGLIRGEFHFATTDEIAESYARDPHGAPVDRMIALDRRGALQPVLEALPERAAMASSADEIGEVWPVRQLAGAGAPGGMPWRDPARMGRARICAAPSAGLLTSRTEHWLASSRFAERELPPDLLAELRAVLASARADDRRPRSGARGDAAGASGRADAAPRASSP